MATQEFLKIFFNSKMATVTREHKVVLCKTGDDWRACEAKFLAVAESRGTHEVHMGERQPDEFGIDEEEVTQRVRLHKKAITDLTMCMPAGKCMEIVMESKTTVLPRGDAHLAWTRVVEEMTRKTAAKRDQLKDKLREEIKLGKRADPVACMDELIKTRNILIENHQEEVSENEVIDQMTKVLHEDYKYTAERIEERRNDDAGITMDQARTMIVNKQVKLETEN